MLIFSDPGDVLAAFAEPALVPPRPGGVEGGMAWLRRRVARFSSGEVHARRRAIAEKYLAAVEPGTLRPLEGEDRRRFPARALAEAIGLGSAIVDDVLLAAAAYHGEDSAAADEAVERLRAQVPGDDEECANLIGLLIQACATTGPPVVATKRVAVRDTEIGGVPVPAGTLVTLRLEGNPFGAEPRVCPGRAHALAMLEELR
ncbi:hypothetical protein [Longispora albida]|uniref:hypothetical protein n=1 Tax=Longispora albida TaxID=203523 RepID=UPI00039EBFD4|nr:hypothetical protein [Longispora albida]